MKKYNIAGIKIALDFNYDTYFKNNLEHYRIADDATVSHGLKTSVVGHISVPKEEPAYKADERSIYRKKTEKVLVHYNSEGIVTHKVIQDFSMKNTHIEIKEDAFEKMDEWEYIISGIYFMEIALLHKRFSLHASAIGYNGKAIVFAAPSGTGKTTHVNYWQELFGPLDIINDDKPFLYFDEGVLMAAGAPFSGKEAKNTNIALPVSAIIFLEQGTENTLKPLSTYEAFHNLYLNTHRPRKKELMVNVLDSIQNIMESTPIFKAQVTHAKKSAVIIRDLLDALL